MFARIPFLFLRFATAMAAVKRTAYCDLPCFVDNEEIENVICTHYPCMPSYMCGKAHKSLPFSDEERIYVLNMHNQYREQVASGREKRGGNGAAADMSVLSYDKEMEFMASCWSNQCQDHPKPSAGRDECRATSKYPANGQNHWADADENTNINWTNLVHVQRAIDSWYSYAEDTSTSILTTYTTNDSKYDFFTQMVWADTQFVGCGRTMFSSHTYTGINIVCNYAPTGNIVGESVYHLGKPCSRYEDIERNSFYTSLCGSIRPPDDDKFLPPFKLSAGKISPGVWFIVTICLNLMLFG